MFVIYTPETKYFLHCVYELDTGPWFEWDRSIQKLGIIPTKNDAIFLADKIQQARAKEDILHFSIQVLRLNDRSVPDFEHPEYDLPSRRRVS